jgi:hypothetical protein
MYEEIIVVVEGVEDSRMEFDINDPIEKFRRQNHINATKRFAYDNSDMDVQIYILFHNHNKDWEHCQCIQYETDHKPFWEQKGKNNG